MREHLLKYFNFGTLNIFMKIVSSPGPPYSTNRPLVLFGNFNGLLILDLDVASAAICSSFVRSGSIRSIHSINSVLVIRTGLKFVERLENSVFLLKDPTIKPPWESGEELVAHMGTSGNSEDVVQFLKGTLLGLWDPEKDHDQCDDIGTGVETEDTLG
jgi:hypothetical protein